LSSASFDGKKMPKKENAAPTRNFRRTKKPLNFIEMKSKRIRVPEATL